MLCFHNASDVRQVAFGPDLYWCSRCGGIRGVGGQQSWLIIPDAPARLECEARDTEASARIEVQRTDGSTQEGQRLTTGNQYAPCSACEEVMTPVNQLCLDCWCPSKQRRQQYVMDLQAQRAIAHESLRYRFAMAALSALHIPDGTMYPEVYAERAFRVADEMLKQRTR